jgi:hypothetical protein
MIRSYFRLLAFPPGILIDNMQSAVHGWCLLKHFSWYKDEEHNFIEKDGRKRHKDESDNDFSPVSGTEMPWSVWYENKYMHNTDIQINTHEDFTRETRFSEHPIWTPISDRHYISGKFHETKIKDIKILSGRYSWKFRMLRGFLWTKLIRLWQT